MPDINKSYSWAIETCNASNVGYSQTYRNQQTVNGITYYDCSSFIWYALLAGDFDVVTANGGRNYPITTYAEPDWLEALGFTHLPIDTEWKAGDILWKTGHTEMVYSGGLASGITMGAHTSTVALANQVSIGNSNGDKNYVSTSSDWSSLYRYGDGGAVPYGVSAYVVAAICGNFWQESNINPGIWESLWENDWESLNHGYGLGQWTNTGGNTHGRLYQLHHYLQSNGYANDSGDGQLAFLKTENYWYPSTGYDNPFNTLDEFLSSNSTDVEMLTHAFNDAWEGIHNDTWDLRVAYANQCLLYIQMYGNDPSIKDWIVGNRYLTEAERLNNAIMIYRWWGAGGGGGGIPSSKRKLPVWLMIRYK